MRNGPIVVVGILIATLGSGAIAGLTPPQVANQLGLPTSDTTKAPMSLPEETLNLCILDIAREDYEQALKRLHALPQTTQYHPTIRVLKATILLGQGQMTAAQTLLARIQDNGQVTSRTWSVLAAEYLKQQQPLPAMCICQQGLMEDAHSSRLLLQAGRAWTAVGQWDQALVLFRQALVWNRNTDDLDERLLTEAIVNTLVALRRYEEAGPLLNDPNQSDFLSPILTLARARYYATLTDYKHALQSIQAHDPAIPERAYTEVTAQIHLLAGRSEQAADLLAPLGDDRTLLVCRLMTGELKQAKALLSKLQKASEPPAELALMETAVLLRTGKWRSARKAMGPGPMPFYEWQDMDTIKPHLLVPEIGTTLALVQYCLDQGFPRQAHQIAAAATQSYPDNVVAHLLLAESSARLGDHAQALAALNRAVECLPDSETLRFLQARAAMAAGQSEQALRQYRDLLQRRPDFVDAALAYGRHLEIAGQYADCVRIYTDALNYNPDRLSLLTAYAWLQLEVNDYRGFATTWQRLEKNPRMDKTTLIHLDGWNAFHHQNFERAATLLTEALDQWPGDPELCYHLGQIKLVQGKRHQGRQLIAYALYFELQREKYGQQAKALLP